MMNPDLNAENDCPFPHQRLWLIALLTAIAISRILLLFFSKRYLMSDEAVVGVMVQDILAGKPIPFFLYGQHYGGGHVVEALLMAPWFALFGPSELIVKGVPLVLGFLYLLLVYTVIYRFFSKRLALLALAFLAGSCSVVSSHFLVNGNMSTLLFAWTGLYFFFSTFYSNRLGVIKMFLAGAAWGFAVYCYDYPVFYIIAAMSLLLFRLRLGLLRQWRQVAGFAGGIIFGAMPLILYNVRHHYENFSRFLKTGESGESLHLNFFSRLFRLAIHDFPASFHTNIIDFAPKIPWVSYLAWFAFCAALGWLVFVMRGSLLIGFRGLNPRRGSAPGIRNDRILHILFFFILYGVIYCISGFAGKAPRYLLPFYPFLPILFAWAILRLGRAKPRLAVLWSVAFLAPQLWLLGQWAGDRTISEWNIQLHGADMQKVAQYLEREQKTTVLAPYEIKWKLMFYSQRRIECAAFMFGFDREDEMNFHVLERLNRGEVPLVMVFDKNLQLTRVQEHFIPEMVFSMDSFHAFLQRYGIQYKVIPIGDYVVYCDFSRSFKFFPFFYDQPLVP